MRSVCARPRHNGLAWAASAAALIRKQASPVTLRQMAIEGAFCGEEGRRSRDRHQRHGLPAGGCHVEDMPVDQ